MLHAPLPQGRSRSDTYPVNMYADTHQAPDLLGGETSRRAKAARLCERGGWDRHDKSLWSEGLSAKVNIALQVAQFIEAAVLGWPGQRQPRPAARQPAQACCPEQGSRYRALLPQGQVAGPRRRPATRKPFLHTRRNAAPRGWRWTRGLRRCAESQGFRAACVQFERFATFPAVIGLASITSASVIEVAVWHPRATADSRRLPR